MGRSSYREHLGHKKRRGGCIQGGLAVAFVLALLALIYLLVGRPLLTDAVADQIGGPVPTLMPGGQQPGVAATAVVGQAGAVLPTAVAALPAGAIVVTDADVNAFLASRPEALAPLDSASVSFSGGKARATVSAYGVTSGASVGLAAQDGQIVVTDAVVDPPLSLVLSGPDLAAALAARLNAELVAQNRSVETLRIEEGQLVLVMR
jgi:hypothetical protein